MKNLTLKDLINFTNYCIEEKIPLDSPVFLGQDDELNGIHTAWYVQTIDKKNKDDKELFELIENDYCNKKAKDINILIS